MKIRVEHRPPGDGAWHAVGPPISPADRTGSGQAFHDDSLVVVLFGWSEDVPAVWLDSRRSASVAFGVRAHEPGNHYTRLADLRDGPFELDSPNGRWRWSLID
jgi:hypothetical protein